MRLYARSGTRWRLVSRVTHFWDLAGCGPLQPACSATSSIRPPLHRSFKYTAQTLSSVSFDLYVGCLFVPGPSVGAPKAIGPQSANLIPSNTMDSVQDAIEIHPNHLYFWVTRRGESGRVASAWGLLLHIDNELKYEPFANDFGLLHLGCTYRFCKKLSFLLKV